MYVHLYVSKQKHINDFRSNYSVPKIKKGAQKHQHIT